MPGWLRIALLGLLGALVLATGRETAVSAQDHAPSLPSGCWTGEVVVAAPGGTFECVELRELLKLSGCSDGDFLTWDSSGGVECVRPSSFSSGARALLPDCSSGQTLVAEGFGRWACADRE